MEWNTKPILEQLWTGKCTVWNYADTFDEDTKQTTQRLVEVEGMSDIPCRLSYKQVADVTSKLEAPVVQLIIKLFLPKTYTVSNADDYPLTEGVDYSAHYEYFENGVWMYDCECLVDLKKDIEETIEKSIEIKKDEMKQPLMKRFIQAIVRIFAPLL